MAGRKWKQQTWNAFLYPLFSSEPRGHEQFYAIEIV